MRTGGWLGAALVALVLAVVPGALQLVPARHGLDRAEAAVAGSVDDLATLTAAGALASAALPAPPVTAPPSPPPPLATVEVPITPPAGAFTGAPAPAAPVAAPYRAARGESQPGEVFALAVGINDYPGSEYDLGAAVADADTVDAGLAHFNVPAANRLVLRDGQARRGQVVAAIQSLVRRAGPGTTVVLAFAGHVRKVDADTEELITAEGATITDRELAALLAPSAASHMWILMATCYAGGFTEVLGPGRILTAAADADSLAYENSAMNGSYLVHYLVREGWLQGQAGPSVQQAFAYADARIASLHADRRPVQLDQAGAPLRLTPTTGPGGGQPPSDPSPPPPTSTPPPSPTTTAPPPRTCVLLVLCSRS
jgi:hypothetical protein